LFVGVLLRMLFCAKAALEHIHSDSRTNQQSKPELVFFIRLTAE
jgi:hypothetical protein